jgi:hypothetical protein
VTTWALLAIICCGNSLQCHHFAPNPLSKKYAIAAVMPAAGIVKIHAQTILCAIGHRTADSRRTAPTPTIAPVIVWVVPTGTPRELAENSVIAPAVSAANPPTGWSLVMRIPIGVNDPPAAAQCSKGDGRMRR